MLIRPTTTSTFECIGQEHHALISGVLAAAWHPTRLAPLLVQTIGLHDNPWRACDAEPDFNAGTRLPYDFITFPLDRRIALYREGITALEEVHPYVAYMVSRHYTTFAGTRDVEALTVPEAARREHLRTLLADELVTGADEALRWIKFFDVFSLHLCLTGPLTREDSIPRWLRDPSAWAKAPDGTDLTLTWRDDDTLSVDPWPFATDRLVTDIYMRRLTDRPGDRDELLGMWRETPLETRPLVLRR